MEKFSPKYGISTLVNGWGERQDPLDAHVSPIYQTSVFKFPDFASADAIQSGEKDGYSYTRLDNPAFRLDAMPEDQGGMLGDGRDYFQHPGACARG